jgi:hypothetical protein
MSTLTIQQFLVNFATNFNIMSPDRKALDVAKVSTNRAQHDVFVIWRRGSMNLVKIVMR